MHVAKPAFTLSLRQLWQVPVEMDECISNSTSGYEGLLCRIDLLPEPAIRQVRHVLTKVGPSKDDFFAGILRRPSNLQEAGFKTFICPTPSQPPLQVHLFSLHTHTPLLFLHPDTRREGSSISNQTSDPPRQPDPSSLASALKSPAVQLLQSTDAWSTSPHF